MQKQYINPGPLPHWSTMFTQVIAVEHHGLKFIHISGQVGVEKHQQLTGSGSFQEELLKVFSKGYLPALSLIGVAALAEERFLIEIDVEAITEINN